jgi:hypothetical protein
MIRKIWNLIRSVKLTVVLFVLILIPSVIGTLVQQNAPDPSRYVEAYGPGWTSLFRFLGFFDVYHDPRFVILLVLLGLNTFACVVTRFKPRWQLAGMMATHLGLLLILLGALAGSLFGVKGFMAIGEGETTNRMSTGRTTQAMAELPFGVKLVDFILDTQEEPNHKLIVFDLESRKQSSHSVEEGQNIAIHESRWSNVASLMGIRPDSTRTIQVEEILPHAALVPVLTEGPEETGIAGAEFRLMNEKMEEQGFASSRLDSPYISRAAGIAVGYQRVADRAQAKEKIQEAIAFSRPLNQLEVSIPGTARKKTYPAEVGARFEIEDAGYFMEVLRYVPDFVVDLNSREVSSRSDLPNNPAVLVRMTSSEGSKERWLFSRAPSIHETGEEPFKIRYVNTNIGDYLLISNVPEGNPIVSHIREGRLAEGAEAAFRQPVEIGGTGYSIAIDGFFENANMSKVLANRPDMPSHPAIEIAVGQEGKSQRYPLWENTPVDVPGYKLMYVQERPIRDFFSVLQIIDGGRVVKEKKIEVNDPLRYEGYAFYQSSYDSQGLSWSGLQVKKDPGVPLVYGGFALQILGMITVFYVNPLVRKVRNQGLVRTESIVRPERALDRAAGA